MQTREYILILMMSNHLIGIVKLWVYLYPKNS